MPYDYEKANVTLCNTTAETDGNLNSPSSVSTGTSRALDQSTNTTQWQTNDPNNFEGRYKNIANADWSNGVLVGHVGHNSPYRVLSNLGGRWTIFSGGSTTTDWVEFDTFSISSIGDSPLTFAHVIDLKATPSRSSGTFDPTDVTRIQYGEDYNSSASSTNLVYLSFVTFLSNVVGLSSTPAVYGTTTLEDVIRGLRNDNFGEGLGGPSNIGKITEAVENAGTLLTYNMPIAIGKSGELSVIDGSNFTHQIGKDWTLAHLTGNGILWANAWDTSISGQSMDMTNATVNMLTPSDWTCFDVDSANVVITLTGTTINNCGDVRLGTSCVGIPDQIQMGIGKVLTVANSIDDYTVEGTLRYEGGAGTLSNVSATRLTLEQAGTYTLVDCSIQEIENLSGANVTAITTDTIATVETNGTVTIVPPPTPSTMSLVTTGAWAIYDETDTLVESGTGNKALNNVGGTDEGTWSIIAHNKGSVAEVFTWNTEDDSTNDFTYGNTQLLRPEGGPVYSGEPTTGVVVSVNADGYVETNVPNSTQEAQVIVNAIQDFLNTEQGLTHMFESGVLSAPIFGILNGVTYYLNIEGYQYDSIAGTTPEAALSAVLISGASHVNIRDDNGSLTAIAAVESISPQDIRDAMALALSGGLTPVDGSVDFKIDALPSLADVTNVIPTVVEIEAALLNDGDGQALLAAIQSAIGNTNIVEATLIEGIRASIERSGGTAEATKALATDIHKWNTNRTFIDEAAFTLTVFDNDGTTPLQVFDLKDGGGAPSVTKILDRVPK